jgi:hypothetical protein
MVSGSEDLLSSSPSAHTKITASAGCKARIAAMQATRRLVLERTKKKARHLPGFQGAMIAHS